MTEVLAYATTRSRQIRSRRPTRCLAAVSLVARALPAGAAELLPAWECVGGRTRARQYAFDGRRVVLVDPQAFGEAASGRKPAALAGVSPDALARALARLRQRCVAAFVPDDGSVTAEYWPYARWRFVQRTAAQALTVLATQQMLRAVGLGACAPSARRRAPAEPLPAQAPAGACPPPQP